MEKTAACAENAAAKSAPKSTAENRRARISKSE
jgi:hypothetical protein